jgi:NadR type nicotinamide-nucleotide adenylyltransferase
MDPVILICLFGPESTGKTTIARRLASRYQTLAVPEVARELVSSNQFSVDDIIRIGKEQTSRVQQLIPAANKILFCDTDVLTTQIYSRVYLGKIPDELFELEKRVHYHHYFLFDVDVPWVADGLRDLPHRRQEMLNQFQAALVLRHIDFTLIQGNWQQREAKVVETIWQRFGLQPLR